MTHRLGNYTRNASNNRNMRDENDWIDNKMRSVKIGQIVAPSIHVAKRTKREISQQLEKAYGAQKAVTEVPTTKCESTARKLFDAKAF